MQSTADDLSPSYSEGGFQRGQGDVPQHQTEKGIGSRTGGSISHGNDDEDDYYGNEGYDNYGEGGLYGDEQYDNYAMRNIKTIEMRDIMTMAMVMMIGYRSLMIFKSCQNEVMLDI
ncbi:hypothetical protein VPH35_032004 [Triticum aestivum]|uniref:uncharacterized protein n=1 Tax=Triticum aestivum TaxID=4565 RepID=UPI001D01FA70|nr:uncharacterized protein LOC123047036 [Triticum aestivum]